MEVSSGVTFGLRASADAVVAADMMACFCSRNSSSWGSPAPNARPSYSVELKIEQSYGKITNFLP